MRSENAQVEIAEGTANLWEERIVIVVVEKMERTQHICSPQFGRMLHESVRWLLFEIAQRYQAIH